MLGQKDETLHWLLESNHPTIRVLVKRDLFGEEISPGDTAALLSEGSSIKAILNAMKKGAYWERDGNFYSPKYTASHWSLLMLHEYQCPPDIPQVQHACKKLLDDSRRWLDSVLEKHMQDHMMACYYGNVLRYALGFGFLGHTTVQDILTFLSHAKGHSAWTCKYNQGLPCSWGAIRTLWGYALLPAEVITPAIQASIKSAVDLISDSREMLQEVDLAPDIPQHHLWDKTSFPLYYQADRLFALRALSSCGSLDPKRHQNAIDWLLRRRRKDGSWRGSNPFRTRSWTGGLTTSDTDRWITLQALRVLQAA